jgi:hypothetical protein
MPRKLLDREGQHVIFAAKEISSLKSEIWLLRIMKNMLTEAHCQEDRGINAAPKVVWLV